MVMPAHVKDRTKREHTARLAKFVWVDREQPVSICELEDGHTLVIECKPEELAVGQLYRFIGRWSDGRRGPQFKASSYVMDTPARKKRWCNT